MLIPSVYATEKEAKILYVLKEPKIEGQLISCVLLLCVKIKRNGFFASTIFADMVAGFLMPNVRNSGFLCKIFSPHLSSQLINAEFLFFN